MENHSSDVEGAQELEALEVEHLKTVPEEDQGSGPAAAGAELALGPAGAGGAGATAAGSTVGAGSG